MSKRSLFWGHGSGKLGEAVFYRAGGEQRTRAYTAIVKNPRTYAQALQRTKLNNMVGAFKDLKVVVESYIKPTKSSQSPFNAFFAENWKRNRWVEGPEELGNNEGIAADFIVSNGTLGINTECSPVEFTLSAKTPSAKKWGFYLPLPVAVDVMLGEEDTEKGYVLSEGRALYEALTFGGNPLGLPSDFYLTIIESSSGVTSVSSYVYTIRCNEHNAEGFTCVSYPANPGTPSADTLKKVVALAGGTIDDTHKAEGATGLVFGAVASSEAALSNGIAVIISYSSPDGFQHTKSVMKYSSDLVDTAGQFLPNTTTGQEIIGLYQSVGNKLGRTDKPIKLE